MKKDIIRILEMLLCFISKIKQQSIFYQKNRNIKTKLSS